MTGFIPATRSFHLSDVLSVLTGALISSRGLEGWEEILNFMMQDYLPRQDESLSNCAWNGALGLCRPALLSQHPQLCAIDPSTVFNENNWQPWVNEQIARFGEVITVRQLVAPPEHSLR